MIVAFLSPLMLGAALLGSPAPEAPPVIVAPYTTVAMVQAGQVTAPASDAPAQVSSGLPEQPAWPRTMSAYWPVFAVFTIAWIGIIGYVLTFGGRIRRVADSITELEPDGTAPPEGVVPR